MFIRVKHIYTARHVMAQFNVIISVLSGNRNKT